MNKNVSVKTIFGLAIPAAFSYATIVLIGVIDLFFIGKLGTVAIAATSVGVSVCTALYSFLDGIRTSTSVLTAQYWGARDTDGIMSVLMGAFLFTFVLGIPILFFAHSAAELIYWLMGNSEIVADGTAYLSVRFLSFPIILATFSLIGFFRGLHNTTMQLIVSVVVCGANIILDYGFIYGHYGLPEMGVKGAAVATLIAEAIGLLVGIGMLLGSRVTRSLISFRIPSWSFLKKHAQMTGEAGMYTGLTMLAISAFVFIFGTLGTKALAIFQIGSQIFFITYLPQWGFFVAVSVIVGKLLGEREFRLIPQALVKVGMIGLITATLTSAATLFFGRQLVGLFADTDAAVIDGVLSVLWIICLDQVLSSVNLIFKGVLTGINDTRFIAKVSFATGYLLFLPLAYLFGIVLNMGIQGGYLAFIFWASSDLAIWILRFLYQKKRFHSMIIPATLIHEPNAFDESSTVEI